MRFDLKTPCANCPFRTDCTPQWLGEMRATGMVENFDNGGTHICHKTKRPDSQHCAGSLILQRKARGGFNGAVSNACSTGELDYTALNLNAPVFDTVEAFVEHHTRKESDG